MALYNNLTGTDLKRMLTAVADEAERYHVRWKAFADYLMTLDAQALTDLGLDAGYQAQLGSLRTYLGVINDRYTQAAPAAQADAPRTWVLHFTDPLVI